MPVPGSRAGPSRTLLTGVAFAPQTTERGVVRKVAAKDKPQAVIQYASPVGAQDIRDTIVIKELDLFLITNLDGNVPAGNVNGLGLYYQDTRFLSTYELVLEGITPIYLLSTGEMRFAEVQELTNPDLRLPNGVLIRKETLTLHRE